jgi:hypothetical protein
MMRLVHVSITAQEPGDGNTPIGRAQVFLEVPEDYAQQLAYLNSPEMRVRTVHALKSVVRLALAEREPLKAAD